MKERIIFDRLLKRYHVYEEFYKAFNSPEGVRYRKGYDIPEDVDDYFHVVLKPTHWIIDAFCWGNHVIQCRDIISSWGSLNDIWDKVYKNKDKRYWYLYKLNNNVKVI
jgi:hypothetical protein